ncbi:MAG: hypothetical protein OXN21_11925 [Chloroflexota bacterium]|nr:hypothetical protein [Chloroflexota bacterium]
MFDEFLLDNGVLNRWAGRDVNADKDPSNASADPRHGVGNNHLEDAIRAHVPTYDLWQGWPWAARHFSVSHHNLWRFLERRHLARPCPER